MGVGATRELVRDETKSWMNPHLGFIIVLHGWKRFDIVQRGKVKSILRKTDLLQHGAGPGGRIPYRASAKDLGMRL